MPNKLPFSAYEINRLMPMDFIDAHGFLNEVPKFGYDLGLNSVVRLCELLGNPQERLSFVHVAGSNGKGSTCAMVSAILQASGYKTGLYLSPFIEDYRDSMYINGEQISKPSFASVISAAYCHAKRMSEQGVHATEFEILTACAFLWFEQSGCDVVVLEAGMGGRLDATNIVTNTLVSVLTAITLDHTEYLGDTIEQITQEKCGIIKQNRITVSYPKQDIAALQIIESCTKGKSNLFIVPDINQFEMIRSDFDGSSFKYRGADMHVSLPGFHQTQNAITAIETANALREHKGLRISDSAIKKGIDDAYLPARQEVLCRCPFVLLDGAHNLQGMQALAHFIKSQLNHRHITVVMGMLSDKQYERSIEIMAGLCDRFIAVPPDHARALNIETAQGVAKKYCENTDAYSDVQKAVREAIVSCPDKGAVIICGSLYLASKAREAVMKQI